MSTPLDPLRLSEGGPQLAFSHANGYPPQAYRLFLEPFLADYQVSALFLRPFWPGSDPDEVQNWLIFRDDYCTYLDWISARSGNPPGKLIGVGHSLGGMATMMAALTRPDRFSCLVLVEPVLFPGWRGTALRAMAPLKLLRLIHPLIRQTLRRKTRFESREAMFDNYRSKPIFDGLSDPVLRDYVDGLADNGPDGGVVLKYPPAWESKIYETGGLADRFVWRGLPDLRIPVLVVRGETSDTLSQKTLEQIGRKLPMGTVQTVIGAGHLVPLEKPRQTAKLALDFIRSVV